MAQRLLMRRGNAAQWTSANPTLAAGEFGVELDTLKVKIGDGTTAWNTLAYISSGGGGGGVTDHGALTGLADDDHPQYLNNARGDARYSALGHGHSISDVTGLQSALDSKATPSDVTAAVAALVDTAPATLDTLNELAAALGDDPNFATTMTNALAGKEPTITAGTTGQYYRGDKTFQTLNKAAVGLANVDNTSDANKPISTATQAALDGKANTTHTHAIADVTGLQTALDGKLGTSAEAATVATINGRLSAGTNITLSGTGTAASPYVINASGGSSDPLVLESTDATAPSAGQLKIFRREVAGLQIPTYVGPVGAPVTVQDHFGCYKIGGVYSRGNITTFITYGCFLAPTTTGFTGTARNAATTNYFTRTKRTGLVTAATANAIGLFRQSVLAGTLGDGAGLGGFFFQITFGISDAAAVANARMFIGAAPVNPTLTNVEPSTILNCIGVGHGAADTNLRIFYGGTTAQTPIDLGANFPANTRSTDMYRLTLHSPSNEANVVYYQVDRLNTGHTASGRLTGDAAVLPQSNTYLDMPNCFRTNGGTALAVGLDISSVYLKTEI